MSRINFDTRQQIESRGRESNQKHKGDADSVEQKHSKGDAAEAVLFRAWGKRTNGMGAREWQWMGGGEVCSGMWYVRYEE